ncbi:hypothetical protein A3K01_01280 [candidate division WWE3 bacterium RIFOXYD1_FULL_43_17]|uniref:Ribosomal RNA adenine methylase transferase N-terminal domain-containing protein n=1 Tax=candidate division WWE3 bacterium RIFOXYD1_FULL_43_17 TaxID=1802652 RepID=A0A1F4XB81_UNCKA|nr:MAG: hypothetical protein A3K01_01280 [candidate division WWE3 bacterium RIFOXYD1_FULL_43_17]
MPDLSISQNFLTDTKLVRQLALKAGISKDDTVLDIGAGKGIITEVLAGLAGSVISLELDPKLHTELKEKFSAHSHVQSLNENFLLHPLPLKTYKVFSNIPFSITSLIVNKLLFTGRVPEDTFLVVQKEAADRFMGKGEGYLFSLLTQPFFDFSVFYKFKREDFTPRPLVDVVMLRIRKKREPLITRDLRDEYLDFICYVVNQQKPTLKLRLNRLFTAIQYYRISDELKFSVTSKVKDLTFSQWLLLFERYVFFVDREKKSITDGSYANYRKVTSGSNKVTRTKVRRPLQIN